MKMLTGLPRTLLFTLRARAEEHSRSHPIIHDPLAAAWHNRIPPAPMEIYTPVFQLGTAVRARLYDAIAQQFLADHPHALVIELGAGLSTRFHRLKARATNDYTTVELDLPEAIAFRRRFDVETGKHRFLSYSMTDKSWPSQLPLNRPQNILLIAEGVLFFLPPNEIAALFALLRRHFPGATIALDVLTNQFSPKARAAFAAGETPMRWFVADETDLTGYGLAIGQSSVVTHAFLERWQALGFEPARLLTGKGNIVVQATINPQPSPYQAIIEEFRANGGKVGGHFENTPLVLLHTTGAKSGLPRLNPVAYLEHGDKLAVFASKAGAPTNPDWYHNIVANPEVGVEVGEEEFRATATIAGEPERTELYNRMAAKNPGFDEYRRKTTRVIPVVILERQA